MIIKLRRYNKIGELLIENEPQGHRHKSAIGMWSGDICNWVAVCMGVKEMGCEQGTGSIQLASESGSRTGTHADTAEQLEEH